MAQTPSLTRAFAVTVIGRKPGVVPARVAGPDIAVAGSARSRYVGPMLRHLMPLAAALRRRALKLLGRDTRGVKVLALDRAARVLLVRHTYGRGDLYMLPGGGIARGERPEAAARRELREETGCHASDLALLGRYESQAEGRRDTIFLFRALTDDAPVADGRELAEAAFFRTDELPATTSPATRRRVEEWLGVVARTTRW